MSEKTAWIIVTMFAIILAFALGSNRNDTKKTITVSDTIVVVDTVCYEIPIPVDSVVVRYKTVKLPIATNRDTITQILVEHIVDSVEVEVPITQKEYKDSTYHAWVSGFQPALDSIHIYQKTTTIHNTEYLQPKIKRWGLGVQAGYGFGKDGFTPYVGVGVHYNIFSW